MNKFTSLIENLKGVPTGTWVVLATIVLLIVNAVLTAFNINPIVLSESDLFKIFSYAGAIASIGYGIWKNFNITDKAQAAGQILTLLKDGFVTLSAVLQFIEEIKKNNNTTDKNNIETAQNASGLENGDK